MNNSIAHEKTLIDLMSCYFYQGNEWFDIESSPQLMSFLSELFSADIYDLIEQAKQNSINPFSSSERTVFAITFNAVIKYAYIKNRLSVLLFTNDSATQDLVALEQACHVLRSMDNDLSELQVIKDKSYSTLFTDETEFPKLFTDRARILLCNMLEDEDNTKPYQIIRTLFRIAAYDINREIEAIYLLLSLNIIRSSHHYSIEIKNIANEMISHFVFLLTNGRVINYRINVKKPSLKSPKEREKTDNTTQMQIIYGYGNFDAYCLRFDFGHKSGKEEEEAQRIHFNNSSPKGIESYLFTQEEYNDIIKKNPDLEKYLVSEGSQFAISEKTKLKKCCSELMDYYKKKMHQPVFSETYDESTVLQFVDIFRSMIMPSHNKTIDTTKEFARYCFRYNKIMWMALCWCIGNEYNHQALIDYSLRYFNGIAELEGIKELDDYDLIEYLIESYNEWFNNN